jgi:hypothetical protein
MRDFDAWVSLISAAEGTSAVSGIFLIVSFNLFSQFDTASPFFSHVMSHDRIEKLVELYVSFNAFECWVTIY